MHIGLGALQVIVQIIPEHTYQIDRILPGGLVDMPWRQDKCNISPILADYSLGIIELGRWMLVTKEDLGCLLELTSCLAELLHEHFAKNNVILSLEGRAKDDSDTVLESTHKKCLITPVVDDGRFVTSFSLFLELKVLLEDGGEAVALDQAGTHG